MANRCVGAGAGARRSASFADESSPVVVSLPGTVGSGVDGVQADRSAAMASGMERVVLPVVSVVRERGTDAPHP